MSCDARSARGRPNERPAAAAGAQESASAKTALATTSTIRRTCPPFLTFVSSRSAPRISALLTGAFLIWRWRRHSPCEIAATDNDRRVIVHRLARQLKADWDQASPAARGMVDKIQASRRSAGLELIDPMNREPKALEQGPYCAAVGSAPQRDRVDVAAGENPG